MKSNNVLKGKAGLRKEETGEYCQRGLCTVFSSDLSMIGGERTVIKIHLKIFWILTAVLGLGLTATPAPSQTPDEIINKFGDYYAIVIGINNYEKSNLRDLNYAEHDAREISHILTEYYGFEVISLYGSEATRRSILKTIRTHITALGENDNLLIFFGGHGLLDPDTDEGFWIPADATDEYDQEGWISFSRLRKLVEATNADVKRVALITDSCYGGALTERSVMYGGLLSPEDDIHAYQKWLIKKAGDKSRLIIASGGFEQVPDQSEFSFVLRDILENNEFDMIDLYYLFNKILKDSNYYDQEQTPLIETVYPPKNGKAAQFVLLRRK